MNIETIFDGKRILCAKEEYTYNRRITNIKKSWCGDFWFICNRFLLR